MDKARKSDSVKGSVAKHTPGPWSACKDGRCPCAAVWSTTADHPVAEVIRGEWGDSFPNIRLRKDESGIGEVAEAFNDKILYGTVDEGTAEANARLIAAAPDLLAALRNVPCRHQRRIAFDCTSGETLREDCGKCDRCLALAKAQP